MNPYKLYANTKFKTVPFYKMKDGAAVKIFMGGKNKFKRDSKCMYTLEFNPYNKEIVYLKDSNGDVKHQFEARNAGLKSRKQK